MFGQQDRGRQQTVCVSNRWGEQVTPAEWQAEPSWEPGHGLDLKGEGVWKVEGGVGRKARPREETHRAMTDVPTSFCAPQSRAHLSYCIQV